MIAQSLYAAGAALCFIHIWLGIAAIVLVQLNYALTPGCGAASAAERLDPWIFQHNSANGFGFLPVRTGACLPPEEAMGTARLIALALNSLARMRWSAFRVMHSGARDGLGFLLIGLAGIGAAIWAVARSERKATAKN